MLVRHTRPRFLRPRLGSLRRDIRLIRVLAIAATVFVGLLLALSVASHL
jgi:hypothetical protein